MAIKYIKSSVMIFCMVALGGCANPLNRLQGSMDQMTYYMGMMAASMPQLTHQTGRLANSTERIEGRTDRLLNDVQKKGASAERALQNYSQTFIDNDVAVVKNLQGIRQEIAELKQGRLGSGASRSDNQDQAGINASINDRISRLEAQIAALNAKIK